MRHRTYTASAKALCFGQLQSVTLPLYLCLSQQHTLKQKWKNCCGFRPDIFSLTKLHIIFSEEITGFNETYPILLVCLLLGTWFSTSWKPRRPKEVTQSPKKEVILVKEPLKGIESSVCMNDSWLSFFFSFHECMAQLSSACPDCSQLMDTLEETAVCDITMYTILLKKTLDTLRAFALCSQHGECSWQST